MNQSLVQNIIVSVVGVVLIFFVWQGFKAGRDISRSRAVISNVGSLQEGLSYFYSDQGRYPSTSEYDNQKLMTTYFENFPPTGFQNKSCTSQYSYRTFRQLSFTLDFCLPRVYGNLPLGVSQVTEKSSTLRP